MSTDYNFSCVCVRGFHSFYPHSQSVSVTASVLFGLEFIHALVERCDLPLF